jgi:hypothetical protein
MAEEHQNSMTEEEVVVEKPITEKEPPVSKMELEKPVSIEEVGMEEGDLSLDETLDHLFFVLCS